MNRRAYRIHKTGSTANLKLTEESISTPANNEVQVAVKAIGLNFADVFAIHGLYSATPKGSFVPGLEFAGVIEQVGADVSGYEVGQRIMGVTRFGGYADRLNIDDRHILAMPDDWNWSEGAGYMVQGLTAYYALIELGNLKKNQAVLIHSGAGGVGVMANRIARNFGAFTIGTVGSETKLEVLKREGFDAQIVRDKNFKSNLQDALGERPLNLVLETIGGQIFKDGYQVMAPQGRMVVVGASQYASPGKIPNYPKLIWQFINRPKIDPQEMIQENKSVMAFNLIWLYENVDMMDELIVGMAKLDLGKPFVGKTYSFDQMHEAIKFFQSGRSTGKVVVEVTENTSS